MKIARLGLLVAALSLFVPGLPPLDASQDQRPGAFYVTGHVQTPGKYPLTNSMTVQEGIARAGGVTARGSIDRIEIMRLDNGERTTVQARLTDSVLPNDTINVGPRSR